MREPVLKVEHVTKTFRERGGRRFRALDDVSFCVGEKECVGIVGESGCGKSTLARVITRLILPDSGSVQLLGTEMTQAKGKELRRAYRNMKMIFQEPRSSFDPRLTLGNSIREALGPSVSGRKEQEAEGARLLGTVGLDPRFADAYPRQVSGGECQRAAIARAIAQKPGLLICDEATSALDVSVQAQIIELLTGIRQETGAAFLFISHDLALVSSFCDRTIVLCGGRVVEEGPTRQIIEQPREEYTKKLVSSVLTL